MEGEFQSALFISEGDSCVRSLCLVVMLGLVVLQWLQNGMKRSPCDYRSCEFPVLMLTSSRLLTSRVLLFQLLGGTFMGDMSSKTQLPSKEASLSGRSEKMKVSGKHHVNGNSTVEPFPEGTQMAIFGMGCFWGAERKFWRQKGVYSTQVGYAGGHTPNPTYQEVCSGTYQYPCQILP
uniref:peptide-methionine (S)-S-oxide reductase n=1 Tax=Pyxicephalus adspersus TaxID=30357 RepID=A0AAV3AM00_PYXAD|nr:TPA: hypothetical protein GDO54_009856 [Pyxicephalus adspersus]